MNSGPIVYLDFVGCRVNEAEIESIARQYSARGFTITSNLQDADIIILNTCAVTNDAARKSRQSILQAGRANPNARIIATGCYAEFDPAGVDSLPGVAHVVPNRLKDHLFDNVERQNQHEFDIEPISREPLPPGTLGRTRAFVKVQDGCDNRCTFCVTTLLRGTSVSRPLIDIVREVQSLVAGGYNEVVLTGVHLGSFGHDLEARHNLVGLVCAILSDTNIRRIRLSSLEPWDLDDSFFELWSNSRLCPHLHLPLQSGSDDILRRMARHTSRQTFSNLVSAARACIPDLTLTGDIIVGFPGETESDFEETMEFVEIMGFARVHAFTYSPRPGTAASRMSGQVSGKIKHQRRARIAALSERLWRSWQLRHVGQTMDVLWESAHGASPDGFLWSGLPANYLRVFTRTQNMLYNSITTVVIDGINDDRLMSTPCEPLREF